MTAAMVSRVCNLKKANHYYKYLAPFGADVCTYCGDFASSDDHVAPIAYVASLVDVVDVKKHKIANGLIIVPSCRDCNSRAGSVIAHSVSEKRAIIHKKLRTKFKKLLGSYDWQEEELNELGYELRTYIRQQEHKRDWILRRLGWPKNQTWRE